MRKRKIVSFLIVIILGIGIGAYYFTNFYYEKPEDAVTNAFDYVIAQNGEKAEAYLDYWQLYGGHHDKSIYQAIMKDFTYELQDIRQSGSEATALLKVSNRDTEAIYGRFVVDAYQLVISDAYKPEAERMGETKMKETIDALLIDYLTNKEADMRSSEIQIDMQRNGRSWYLNIDHEDMDAIYGGFLTAQEAADNVLGDLSTEALANLERAYQQNIDDAHHILRNAVHYVVDDIWNATLCDIVSCINAGTDVDGNEYDLKAGMEKLDKLINDRAEFDSYIEALDDVNYSEIKKGWQSLTQACDELIQELKENDPEPLDYDYIPDTADFENAMEHFVKLVYPEE